ncbi:phage head spike fiber domain-containing protein [Agitococcus lubricus]|uniref:Uncharacterized protein n=1 Tax=Agitococcus lubricus TaxID=1077255 RepID=A0A2T5IPQ6_9GAMM|nr:hypothetical protein [Agitococcus lubricus]PTQ85814.1 hypothetical protein C8N29_1492 [Agitococcus lubricus]
MIKQSGTRKKQLVMYNLGNSKTNNMARKRDTTLTTIDFSKNSAIPTILTTLAAVFARAQTRFRWNSAGGLDLLAANEMPIEWDVKSQRWGYLPHVSFSSRWSRSNEPDNAVWIKNGYTATATTMVSPYSALNARFIAETATTAAHEVTRSNTVNAASASSIHLVIKMQGRDFFAIRFKSTNGVFSDETVVFGGLLGANAYVHSNTANLPVDIVYRGNGWYDLCVICVSKLAATGTIGFVACSDSGIPSLDTPFLGDTTKGFWWFNITNDIIRWKSPVIVTTTSNITNIADVLYIPSSALEKFDSAQAKSFVCEFRTNLFLLGSSAWYLLSHSNPASANNERCSLVVDTATSGKIQAAQIANGVGDSTAADLLPLAINKAACSFRKNKVASAINGGQIKSTFLPTNPPNADRIYIGCAADGTRQAATYLHTLKIYHSASLSMNELVRLTK